MLCKFLFRDNFGGIQFNTTHDSRSIMGYECIKAQMQFPGWQLCLCIYAPVLCRLFLIVILNLSTFEGLKRGSLQLHNHLMWLVPYPLLFTLPPESPFKSYSKTNFTIKGKWSLPKYANRSNSVTFQWWETYT